MMSVKAIDYRKMRRGTPRADFSSPERPSKLDEEGAAMVGAHARALSAEMALLLFVFAEGAAAGDPAAADGR